MTQTRITPALRALIEQVRADDIGAFAELAEADPVPRHAAVDLLDADTVDDLVAEGWLDCIEGDDLVRLAVALHAFNGLVSVLPGRQRLDADFVHLNFDSFWMLDLIWQHAPGGTWAVELGTGNGLVAAHLVAKYRRVIATDLPGPWMRCAKLTLEANEARGRPTAAIACDIASALRPAMFDLVASNMPWSPSPPLDDQGRKQTFMDGGPTGTELPSRFLHEAVRLLAPGGVAIMLGIDPTFDDGRRPLELVLDEIESPDTTVELVDSAVFEADRVTAGLQKRLPNLSHARHVGVIIRRTP